jgi:hypothetical protein
MISNLNLNPLSSMDKNNTNDLLIKRENDISNLNIIGAIVGILLGVIDNNYINRLPITDEKLIIGLHTIKLIIYVSLIGVAGTTYTDFYSIIKAELTMSDNSSPSTSSPTPSDSQKLSKNIVDDSARWKIAIKPLVPFLCGLSIQTLIIIITNIEKMSSSHSILKSESSDELPSPEN